MYKKEITDKYEDVKIEKIEKVGGTFKNDAGQDINWHSYKLTIDLGNGYRIKAKVEKVYNELLDELEEQE